MPKVKNKPGYLIACGLFLAVLFLALMLGVPRPAPAPAPTVPVPTGYYSAQEFMLDGQGFMTYTGGSYMTGIDVSGYQGDIDWQKVRDSGIRFVFIKVGSRGTTEGGLYPDTYAQGYYEGAKAAGLLVGAYFFSQAITPQEAKEEARFALKQIDGWALDLPLAYDWEWGGEDSRTTGLSRETLTQCALDFCEIIENHGYSAMLYFNESQGLEQMELTALSQYPFWLAQYDGEMNFPHAISFWQYSQAGTVDGIDGPVDLNICILP